MGGMGSTAERQANVDRREVYLPRVPTNALQPVSNTGTTVITLTDAASAPQLSEQERAALTLTVHPGSAIGEDGHVLDDVQIGISTVPPELVRDMLPPGVLQHTFDITIQAPGVATFAEPVRINSPNVFHAAPGTKLNLLSFDHTTGRLVINGTGTVSADGLTVVSDPDSGIRAPGWHWWTPPVTVARKIVPPPPPKGSSLTIRLRTVDLTTFAPITDWVDAVSFENWTVNDAGSPKPKVPGNSGGATSKPLSAVEVAVQTSSVSLAASVSLSASPANPTSGDVKVRDLGVIGTDHLFLLESDLDRRISLLTSKAYAEAAHKTHSSNPPVS